MDAFSTGEGGSAPRGGSPGRPPFTYIRWLDEPAAAQPEDCGAKAATLARLSAAGLPVPGGFCVLTSAFELVARQGGLNAPLPAALEAELRQAYRLLVESYPPEVKLAVRSSAAQEDLPGASFAGQYTSVLNVRGADALLEALHTCWNSMFSEAARAYQDEKTLAPAQGGMGVLVQRMVPAEWAGVLFTADPRSGDSDQLIVELAAGQGDALLSGEVTPLRLSIRRAGGAVTVLHAAGQSEPGWQRLPWADLAALAERIEALLGGPQDIEWAWQADAFWILQSRPITTRGAAPARQVWTRANAGEILPGVVTPLTWSVFRPLLGLAGYFRSLSPLTQHWVWEHPAGQWPESPALFGGRAYMELSLVYAGFAYLPGVTPAILQRMLGFEFDLLDARELPVKKPRRRWIDPLRRASFWLEMLGFIHTIAAGEAFYRRTRPDEGRAGEPPEATLARIERLSTEAARVLGLHLQCTAFAFSAYGLLDALAGRQLPSETKAALESTLTSDYQAMSTAGHMLALWDLAHAFQQAPAALALLLESDPLETCIPRLRALVAAGGSRADQAVLRLWETFIAAYGDRASQEFELSIPRWEESPGFVLGSVRDIVQNASPDPRQQMDRQKAHGQRAFSDAAAAFSATAAAFSAPAAAFSATAADLATEPAESTERTSAWKARLRRRTEAWSFERYYRAFVRFVPLRENLKHQVVRRFYAIRQAYLGLGALLVERGALAHPQDIFFLTREEVRLAVTRQPDPASPEFAAWQELAARRQRTHQENQQAPTPGLLVVIDGKATPLALSGWRAPGVLQGIPCSSGVVSGPAYILYSSELPPAASIPAGSILVAPSIDPGMTPLFHQVAGLVTEIGGVLSHGATLAREFGLPAVVAVPGATHILQPGQVLVLDGFTGRITYEAGGDPAHGEHPDL